MQFSESEEMKNARSNNNNNHKYEKVSQNEDKSEIVIFQSNKKISVSFFLKFKFLLKILLLNRVLIFYKRHILHGSNLETKLCDVIEKIKEKKENSLF